MLKRWGWFMTLLKGKKFKIKLLYFKEGGSISLQRHKFRSELWLFVFGEMVRDLGKTKVYYKGGLWSLISEQEWHKFTAVKPSLVLEVQFGVKCSDMDIERK